jgi:hypothetical protein
MELHPAVESLQERRLLSAVAPSSASDMTVSVVHRGALTVALSAADRQDGRLTSTPTSESGLDEEAGTAKTVDGKGPTQSQGARDDGDGGNTPADKDPSAVATTSLTARDSPNEISATRHSSSHDDPARDVVDSLEFVERRSIEQTSSIGLTDDAPAVEPEQITGAAGDGGLDPLGAASVVAWAPSSGLWFGVPGAGPGELAATGAVVWGPEIVRSAATNTEDPGGDLARSPVTDVLADSAANNSTWGDLVDRALHGDWDGLDGELRRFLSRSGGVADALVERGWAPSWPLWIGAAAITVLARQAFQRRGRFLGRPRLLGELAPHHHPIPVGPWPLSSR